MAIDNTVKSVREASSGWYIQRLAGRLDTAMTDALSEVGLTLAQFPILMTALEFDGLTQADYAKRFRKPAYAISRAIDALVEQKLLERRPDENSRRAHNIHVTDAGRAMAPQLFAIIKRVNADMLEPLEPKEAATLLALLSKTLNAT